MTFNVPGIFARAAHLRWAALAIVLLGAACGCGAQASNMVKVSGIVTLEGAPVAGAQVTYYPSSGEDPAMAITDSAGRFELSTFHLKTRQTMEGALPGEYKVTVAMPPPSAGRNPGSSDSAGLKTGHMARPKPGAQKQGGSSAGPQTLPANYADPAKTPLKQVVPPQGRVELKLTKGGA